MGPKPPESGPARNEENPDQLRQRAQRLLRAREQEPELSLKGLLRGEVTPGLG